MVKPRHSGFESLRKNPSALHSYEVLHSGFFDKCSEQNLVEDAASNKVFIAGEAVSRGHVKVCKALAAAGAVKPDVFSQRVNGGFTLLHLAAGAGSAATVQWILERTSGAGVNDARNEEGLSPLHCCVLGGNLNSATVHQLADWGADMSVMYAPLPSLHLAELQCFPLQRYCNQGS
jgi:hypothetical protein